MKRILLTLLIAAVLCISATGIAEQDSMWFDKTVNTVFEGETLQLVLNRGGLPAEGEVEYQSANTKVLTVDGNGVVTGVTKGQAVITATVKTEKKSFRAQLQVRVARKAESIEVNTAKLMVFAPDDPLVAEHLQKREKEEENALPVLLVPLKKKVALPCTVLPKDATSLKAVLTAGEEGDQKIIQIQGNTVTGLEAGETILTIANDLSPEVQTQFRVLVIRPVSRITLTASEPTVAVGSRISLASAVAPEDATIQGVSWTSGYEQLASVDENGVVSGLKRGNVRIIATALDGSNVRANINIRVVQNAEEVTLDKQEATVDIQRNILLKATVLPKDTDDKGVLWTSSDENIATVNAQGRVTGVSVGECEITCTSKTNGEAKASAVVHVQKPVTKITLDPAPAIYTGETGKLTWSVEPADATNPGVQFKSLTPAVLAVDEDGTVTGLKRGEGTVEAVSTDGSNRKARIKVRVMQHLTGVHMLRQAAYINEKESANAGAVLEPKDADNNRMSWESSDTSIVTVTGDTNRMRLTGISEGSAVVTGTTEDGGFRTSINVYVGDWDFMITLLRNKSEVYGSGKVGLYARNDSEMPVNSIVVEVSVWDANGNEVPANSKDGSNVFKMNYRRTLRPGATTYEDDWQYIDFMPPESFIVSEYRIKILSYQIDQDWIKTIRKYRDNRNQIKLPVHL